MHNRVNLDSSLDENIITYMLCYFPPLIVDDFSKSEKLVPAAIFYAVLAVLMLCADTLYVNPFFLVFGYRIYRATLESGRKVVIITRRSEVLDGERLNLYEVQASRLYYAE